MLNEGLQLQQSLERAGLTPERKHPKLEKVPRTPGPCLRVRLSADGEVTDVAVVADTDFALYWQYSLANGSTFPVTRLREPLMERGAALQATEKSLSDMQRLEDEIRGATPRRVSEGMALYLRGLYRANGEIESLRTPLTGKPEAAGVLEVIRRFEKAFPRTNCTIDKDAAEATLNDVREKAIANLNASSTEAVRKLLFDAASGGGNTVQLAFDLDGNDSIYTLDVRKQVVALLLEAEANTAGSDTAGTVRRGVCALTGRDTNLQSATFPKVRLPLIFEKGLPLFSMNTKEAECNSRYHRKDSELFPVAPGVALAIQDAYGYLLQDKFKHQTWQTIASDQPDSRDLLIAYLDSRPSADDSALEKSLGTELGLARFFDRVSEFDITAEEELKTQTERLCDALRARRAHDPATNVALLVLRKASEGTGFVLFSALPPAETVMEGARWWAKAANNVPYIRIPTFVPGESKPKLIGPLPVMPGDIVALLTEAWTETKGTLPEKGRTNKLRGVSFATALNLMIEYPHPRRGAAAFLLEQVLDHSGPLLLRIGACQWRRDFTAFKPEDRRKALRAISLLGITLQALDAEKETYMHSSAFLMGRFLALADRLHYDYCMVVRNGQIPPGLIGNSTMATALKNPLRAFSLLSDRMPIYIGWAKTAPTEANKHSRLAKAVLKEYQTVADQLAAGGIPHTCDDKDRAQMLLGYLASTKSAVPDDDGDADTDTAHNEHTTLEDN